MDTNQKLYLTALEISRKDERGRAFSIGEFNHVLLLVTHDFFTRQFVKYELTKTITDSLLPFVRRASLTISDGMIRLPTTSGLECYHIIGDPEYATGDGETTLGVPNRVNRNISLVTEKDYSYRQGNFILTPTTYDPIGVERWASSTSSPVIYIYPSNLTTNPITIRYLKWPVTPFLDYYLDSNLVVHYLDEGDTHTMVTGDTFPVGTSPGVGATYTSQTKEMEWRLQDRPAILYMILQHFGITVDDETLAQYGIAKEDKTNVI